MIRLWVLILVIVFISCLPDKPVDNQSDSIEDIYFKDYESPKEKWGFLDSTGAVIIKPIYDDVRDMITSLTAANYKGRWGFINLSGKKVIDFKFKQVHDFDSELESCIVQTFSNQWLLINQKGQVIDSLNYDNYKSAKEGFYPVASGSSWGLIDIKGKEIIKPNYESIKVFNNRCIVRKYSKYGLISIEGDILMPIQYDKIDATDSAMLRVKQDGKCAFYDSQSYKKVSPDYNYASQLEDGFFFTKSIDKTFSIINEKFNVLSSLKADKVEYGGEGKWKYKEGGKWGLMKADGTRITEPLYDLMNRYQEDYILFSIADRWGYLDSEGEVFIEPLLPLAWEFKNGYARIFHRNGVGFIDTTKTLIIDKRMFEVRDFYNGKARFQTM